LAAADPRSNRITPDDLEDCPNPIYALQTDTEVFETTKRLMEKYNITGVVSGPEDYVRRWGTNLGRRLVPGISMHKPGDLSLDHLRELIDSGKVRVLGEIALQYTGLSPEDPAFEPYWALAASALAKSNPVMLG